MNANFWIAIFLSCICDAILAAAIAFFVEPAQPLIPFAVILAAFLFVPFLLGLWGGAKYWIGYHLMLKRILVRQLKATFHRSRFPSGAEHFDADQYLDSLVENEDLDIKIRLKAAYLMGEKAGIKDVRPWMGGLATHLAYGQALDEYRPQP